MPSGTLPSVHSQARWAASQAAVQLFSTIRGRRNYILKYVPWPLISVERTVYWGINFSIMAAFIFE